MKDIQESLLEIQGLVDYINEQSEHQIDEGLGDIFNALKKKFKQVVNYLKGICAKISDQYWCLVDEDGKVYPVISPLTSGQAYVDGCINTDSTLVCLNRQGKRIIGLKTAPKDAIALYGKGNSLDYWKKYLMEHAESLEKPINEVKMHTEDPAAKYNVVDTPDLKAEIAMCFKNKNLARLMIWGAPGIGKTAILMSVLDSLPNGKDYNLVVKTLSNETPDNFTLPKYIEINGCLLYTSPSPRDA